VNRCSLMLAILLPIGAHGQPLTGPTRQALGSMLTSVPTPTKTALKFTRIDDAAMDRAGNVYVLDRKQSLLAVFAESGALITTMVDKSADGGEEKHELTALAIDSANILYVLDRIRSKVTKLRLHGKSLDLVDSFDTRASMGGLCIIGSALYLIGIDEGRIVHRYDLTGRYLGSFGSPYSHNFGINQTSTTLSGHLACLPEAKLVTVATTLFKGVRGYSPSGTLLWEFSVPGFRQMGVDELPDGSYTLRMNKGPTDAIVGLFRGFRGRIVGIQVIQVQVPGAKTLFVDARTGTLIEWSEKLPRIRRTVRDLAVVLPYTQAPTVAVYEWR
jgi:hypothetical protein